MNTVLNVYKPIGMTPLELIGKVREIFPEYKNEKISYAGRLDPMAHGVMLFLIGDAIREREKYLGLNKEYVFEALFGFSSDTYDMLGEISDLRPPVKNELIVKEKVNIFVKNHKKTFLQSYPSYSSKTVKGKPLFWWSRQNRLSEITIPARQVTVEEFDVLSMGTLSNRDLKKLITQRIDSVQGDFRQEIIKKKWDAVLSMQNSSDYYTTAKFRIGCSSGTYVRSLVHALGNYVGTGAVALDILRTQVGGYSIDNGLKLQSP